MAKQVYLGLIGDIIHPGIVNIIRRGAEYGDLTVGLYTDKAIATYKRLPYLNYSQREDVVASIKGVSRIVPQDDWSYIPNIKKIRPDYVIHGDDWKTGPASKLREEVVEVLKEWGGELIEIPYTRGIDSTSLVENAKSIGTTPDVRLKSLRRLLAAKPIVRILEAHSGLSGLIAEHVEVAKEDGVRQFDGMWSSSLTDSTSKGKPDIEAVDLTTRLHSLTDILECTTKPIIYDGDTGGIAEHFVFTVRTLERNGVSAVIIEDKVGLKKNSLFGTEVKQELASEEEFCGKIAAGKRAQVTQEFMIIARIEELIAGFSVHDALSKAFAAVRAGADGVMIHSKNKDGLDVRDFCLQFRREYPSVPIVLVPTTYNQYRESELESWGARIIIYANHMLRASYPAMKRCAERILENERSLEVNDMCMPIKEILGLIPGTK